MPQFVPSHVAVPFGSVGHALPGHREPHVAVAVLLTHAVPHK